MHMSIERRRQAASVRSLAIVAAALGVSVYASVCAAHAGKLATNRMYATAGNKATSNPIRPKAIRDHRIRCRQFVATPGACPKRPYPS